MHDAGLGLQLAVTHGPARAVRAAAGTNASAPKQVQMWAHCCRMPCKRSPPARAPLKGRYHAHRNRVPHVALCLSTPGAHLRSQPLRLRGQQRLYGLDALHQRAGAHLRNGRQLRRHAVRGGRHGGRLAVALRRAALAPPARNAAVSKKPDISTNTRLG